MIELKRECGNCEYFGKVKMFCYLKKETKFTHEKGCYHHKFSEWYK